MQRPDGNASFEGARLVCASETGHEYLDGTFLLSSLLVSVAKGDGSISQPETARMLDLILAQSGTRHAKAMEMLTSAVMQLANDPDLPVKLQQIAKNLSREEKDAVFSGVIEIAMVDDQLDPGEIRSIDFAGHILGLSQDRIHAELRAITNP